MMTKRARVLALLVCLTWASAAMPTTYGPTGWNAYSAYTACKAQESSAGNSCTQHYDNGSAYYQLIFNAGGYNVYRYEGAACVAPETPQANNTCAVVIAQTSAAECAAFKADPAFGPRDATYTTATPCIGGCSLAKKAGTAGFNVTVGGVTQYWGTFELTGSTCLATQATPSIPAAKISETPPNTCTAAGDGQTFCTRNDGKQCYSASTGRQICWGVAETGQKRDKSVAQVRCNGTAPCTAPTISGETVTATGTQMTTTTTTSTSTSSTTTNNFTTSQAAAQNTGEEAANSATVKVATGGSCDSSYMCSGDAIACASLEEQRKARCAIEHKGEGITGGDNCLDVPTCTGAKCDASAYAITVQTWKAQCATKALGDKADTTNSKLDAIKTAIEGIEGGTGTGTGTITDDGTVPGADDGPPGVAESAGLNVATEFGAAGLDDEGRGMARSCPTLPPIFFMNTTMNFDISWLCTGGEIESVILLLVVSVFCLRYIGAA